jgi:hypothetical protein
VIAKSLEVQYRRLVVKHVLRVMENGQTVDNSTVTQLNVVPILFSVLCLVKLEMTTNCFRHGGFVPPLVTGPAAARSASGLELPAAPVVSDAGNIWDHLRASSFCVAAEVGFDFCTTDSEMTVNDTLTVEAVVQWGVPMNQRRFGRVTRA